MKHHSLQEKLRALWGHRSMLLVALTMVLTAGAATVQAGALYILTGSSDSAIILDDAASAPEVESQLVYVTTGTTGYDLTLTAGQTVTVRHGGETVTAQSRKETVTALLKRLHIQPGPLDMVGVDIPGDGVSVTVDSDIVYYDKVAEDVTFETVRVAAPIFPRELSGLSRRARSDIRTSVYEVVWSNGKEVSASSWRRWTAPPWTASWSTAPPSSSRLPRPGICWSA